MANLRITELASTTTGAPTTDLIEVVTGGDNLKIPWHDFAVLSQPDIVVRVYKSTVTGIPSGAVTAIPFNSEREDDYAFHNPAVNPSRVTVPAGYGGLYVAFFNIQWQNHITGRRLSLIRLNGAAGSFGRQDWEPQDTTRKPTQLSMGIGAMVATDYLEGCVFHNRGANLNVNSVAQLSPEFTLMRIGRSP